MPILCQPCVAPSGGQLVFERLHQQVLGKCMEVGQVNLAGGGGAVGPRSPH
jgi:hypothetical protein